jgi:hypothetical protein
MGDKIDANRILVGKLERKRPLGKPISTREYNIKRNLKERDWEDVEWIYLAQNVDKRQIVVNTV